MFPTHGLPVRGAVARRLAHGHFAPHRDVSGGPPRCVRGPPPMMDAGQRREARVAMAMLPAGAILAVGSLLAVPVLLLFAIIGLFGGIGWRMELWYLLAAAVGLRNGVKGIEIVSAFDWRPLPFALILWALVVALHPGG
jgi:hypothetical protein